MAILFCFLISFALAVAIPKSIVFLYVVSVDQLILYGYSYFSRKFADKSLILYNLLLTSVLTYFALCFPLFGFTPASLK